MKTTETALAQEALAVAKPGLHTAVMAGHFMIDANGMPSEETRAFSSVTKRIALEMNALRERLSFCTLVNDWTIRPEQEGEMIDAAMIRQAYWVSVFGTNGRSDGLWTPDEANQLRFLQGIGQSRTSGAPDVVPHGRISEKYLQNTFGRMRRGNPVLNNLVTDADRVCNVEFCGTSNEKCASEYFGLIPVLTRQKVQQLISFVPYCCKAAIDSASQVIADRAIQTGLLGKEQKPFRIVNVFLDTDMPLLIQKDSIRQYEVR